MRQEFVCYNDSHGILKRYSLSPFVLPVGSRVPSVFIFSETQENRACFEAVYLVQSFVVRICKYHFLPASFLRRILYQLLESPEIPQALRVMVHP